jgi:hypothetical protein
MTPASFRWPLLEWTCIAATHSAQGRWMLETLWGLLEVAPHNRGRQVLPPTDGRPLPLGKVGARDQYA